MNSGLVVAIVACVLTGCSRPSTARDERDAALAANVEVLRRSWQPATSSLSCPANPTRSAFRSARVRLGGSQGRTAQYARDSVHALVRERNVHRGHLDIAFCTTASATSGRAHGAVSRLPLMMKKRRGADGRGELNRPSAAPWIPITSRTPAVGSNTRFGYQQHIDYLFRCYAWPT
jgi:hypothetical protein